MTVKVGINGFGRVAKACLRASLQHQDVEVVAVNSIRDPNLLAHLLKYDTVYGTLEAEVKAEGQNLIIDGRRIKILAQRDPALLGLDGHGRGDYSGLPVLATVRKRQKFTKQRGKACYYYRSGKDWFDIVMSVNERLRSVGISLFQCVL